MRVNLAIFDPQDSIGVGDDALVVGDDDRGTIGLRPDLREFGIGAQMLLDQKVRQLRLVSTIRAPIVGIEAYGVTVVDTVPIPPRTPEGDEASS